jgi:hypothetical protein
MMRPQKLPLPHHEAAIVDVFARTTPTHASAAMVVYLLKASALW